MARKTLQRPEPSLWGDSRSSALPKPKVASKPKKQVRVAEDRSESLKVTLESGTVLQGVAYLRSIGVKLKTSGACVQSYGDVAPVPHPKTVADWIRKNWTEIRRVVNDAEQA